MSIYLGCAGWSLARDHWPSFPSEGTHLQRYAAVLSAVEINSSFYRPHRTTTYERWARSVPAGFRFCVKVPKSITHVQRLQASEQLFEAFMTEADGLGEQLGCLLIQLPPSLGFDVEVVETFLQMLRQRYSGCVAIEPRHSSWFAPPVQACLVHHRVAQVAADPPRALGNDEPGGWPGFAYYRLHGSPTIYHSSYSNDYLRQLAAVLRQHQQQGFDTWCIFDNTASGAAMANALQVLRQLDD